MQTDLFPTSAPGPTPAVAPPPVGRVIYSTANEYKLVALRECPVPFEIAEQPEHCQTYWLKCIATHPYYNPEQECVVVLLLNCRKRIRGHQLLTIGTKDTCLVNVGEVFRAACIDGAACIVVMHNHPSGDPTPSEADIKITRELIRAGQTLKIEVLDHVIIGKSTLTRDKAYASLRELGYFSF